MLTVAYLANEFPSPVEPYVGEEIEELERRGVRVVRGSVRTLSTGVGVLPGQKHPDIILQHSTANTLLRAAWLCVRKGGRIAPLVGRILFQGREGFAQRIKALLHTLLGACYAVMLAGRGVAHIHVHHGYFGSWIAMTAARLRGVGYSLTLHGSDLLLHGSFLDVKLAHCKFCFTVSEYNRQYILDRCPGVPAEKIVVSRMGVAVPPAAASPVAKRAGDECFRLLAVGRLHPVKDHAFLVKACVHLVSRGVNFECLIAGDGPERKRLELLIQNFSLSGRVRLLGHTAPGQVNSLYDDADLVVLTSRSEGIPLVLMEAMARGKIVLAPAITGIPELVAPGQTGFLYEPGSQDSFVDRLLFVHALMRAEAGTDPGASSLHSAVRQLHWMRRAAQTQVRQKFNREKNLKSFADQFLGRITPGTEKHP